MSERRAGIGLGLALLAVGALAGCGGSDKVSEPQRPLTPSITIERPASNALVIETDSVLVVGTASAPTPIRRIAFSFVTERSLQRITERTIFRDSLSNATTVRFKARQAFPRATDTVRVYVERDGGGTVIRDSTLFVLRVRTPTRLSLATAVPDTLWQRGFSVRVDIDSTSIATPVLVLDPGTSREQVVDGAKYLTTEAAVTGSPFHLTLAAPETLATGLHRWVVRTYDRFGTRPESLSGSFVTKLGDARYRVVALPGLGGTDAYAAHLNDDGLIAGWASDAPGIDHPILWTSDGSLSELPLPSGSVKGRALDVNNQGWVIGCATDLAKAILWIDRARPTLLDETCAPARINNLGMALVGATFTSSILRYADGRRVVVPIIGAALNDQTKVVGRVLQGDRNDAPDSWPAPSLPYLLMGCCGHWSGRFIDLNNRGQALGGVFYGQNTVFLSDATGAIDLTQALGTPFTALTLGGVSDAGTVVALDGRTHGLFLWNGRTSAITLDDPAWIIDDISRPNASDAFLAHATNTITGKRGALLLVPKR